MNAGSRRPRLVVGVPASDITIAVAIAAIEILGGTLAASGDPGDQGLDALGYALLLVGAAALVVRRRFPSVTLLVVAATSIAYYPLGYPEGPIAVSAGVALYTSATMGRRWVAPSVAGLWLAFTLVGGYLPAPGRFVGAEDLLTAAAVLVAVLLAGDGARSRRAYAAEAQRRAEQAERMRAHEAERRAGEERLRIARELHDVLSHSISLINVQAGVAAHLLDQDPTRSRTSLEAIKGVSKDALTDLRTTLGVLRDGDSSEHVAPSYGRTRIAELVERTAAAGQPVRLHIEGERNDPAPEAEQAAYRIVQEALTNVTRHAPGAETVVRLVYRERELLVRVDNAEAAEVTTTEGGTGGGGNGIVGMRERARDAGGTLQAEPRAGGGFCVRAALPHDRG